MEMSRLAELTAEGGVVALTGAGMSTDSGIPDYRGPNTPPRTPMTIEQFRSGPVARQRYWARSYLGWKYMGNAQPNAGHTALAQLESAGSLAWVITQNVDGLHQAAGSRRVTDLHGRVDEVVCLDCAEVTPRSVQQERLTKANPGFGMPHGSGDDPAMAPDGDADLEQTDDFVLVDCQNCGGTLKPHVVFFGENVPRERVDHCYQQVEQARVLLVAGSSLTVQSGLRFVRRAHQLGTPVAIVNRGATRGDEFASVRLDAGCSEVLTALAASTSPVR